ncbi:MAG: excinuclease ABC subunit UvrA, partial [Thermodesulfobacteriota bacterium]
MLDKIVINGAREHNLKNIDVEIPRDRLVVITGLSGSGKSSLAFDTIYAEGQRRYVESLSAYARQFLEQMEKPDVDSIEGLSPAISIEQKTTSKNPRSTVGTVTEVYDYLRLLFARVGSPYCYECGKEITAQTIQQMVDRILELPEGSRVILLSPIVRGRKGEYRNELYKLRKEGFLRVRIDGAWRELEEEITLDKYKQHYIDVVIDRLIIKEGVARRLADSLEIATRLSDGLARVEQVDGEGNSLDTEGFLFNESLSCIDCGISYPEISPRMFSFNSPHGACPDCKGIGTKVYFDPNLIIPDRNLSLRDGAVVPWEKRGKVYLHQILDALSKHYDFDIYTPFKDLSSKVQDMLFYGSKEEDINFYYDYNGRRHYYKRPFEGIIENLSKRYLETDSALIREDLEKYMDNRPCPTCMGARLKKESLHVKIQGLSIADVSKMSIKRAMEFFNEVRFEKQKAEVARRILKEILE